MISTFNKQLIKEFKKLHTNEFEDILYGYKKLLEQEASPTPADTTSSQAPQAQPQPTQPATQEIPMEKSYTDILIIIAKALIANLAGDRTEGTSNFDSYKELKGFAETWIAQENKAEQIKDSEAVAEINKIQQHLNNILGSAEQAN